MSLLITSAFAWYIIAFCQRLIWIWIWIMVQVAGVELTDLLPILRYFGDWHLLSRVLSGSLSINEYLYLNSVYLFDAFNR